MGRYNATYTSVWDGGYKKETRVYVTKKKEITRWGKSDHTNDEMLEVLEDEYVDMDNGIHYIARDNESAKLYPNEEHVVYNH